MKWMFRTLVALSMVLMYSSFRENSNETTRSYAYSYENVLGTSFDLKVMAITELQADLAEQEALAEIDRLSNILSSYDKNSEFSRWQQTFGVPIKISSELFQVLRTYEEWIKNTGGALNPGAAAIINLWKNAASTQQFPAKEELALAVKNSQETHWILNAQDQTAIHNSRTTLVLNSFVKSYIIQKVADKLNAMEGISGVVVNIGGDIVVRGNSVEKVSIANPKSDAENAEKAGQLELRNKAIATSGNYRRGFMIQNKWFSHIVDGRTGLPAAEIISATVTHSNAEIAAALATTFNILSPGEAVLLAEKYPGTEYLIITKEGKQIKSNGWDAININQNVISPKSLAPTQKSWNKDFEVAISLELTRFEGRSRRPFVAIWVENSNKETVRTVALWFNKPRWLPDLKEWFRKNKDRYQNGSQDVYSISSATRAPGSYTLKWDGKNDNGEYVKPDTYTVYIEVVREHGGYELLKQVIECKKKPQQFSLTGSVEMNSATVEYKKTETVTN